MKTTSVTNTFLKYLINKLTPAQLSGVSSLWLSLHTASPAAGNQKTSEAAYEGYARVELTYADGSLSVDPSVLSTHSEITFPRCTDDESVVAFWGLGTTEDDTGTLLTFGGISPAIRVSEGLSPVLVPFECIREVYSATPGTQMREVNEAFADALVNAQIDATSKANAARAGSLRVYATCAALRADAMAPTLNPFAYVLGVGFFARAETAVVDGGNEATGCVIVTGDTAGYGYVKQNNPAVP